MSVFVVDASVAVKWLPLFSKEPLYAKAQQVLERWAKREIELIVPDLFWLEISNVLWKTTRRGMCNAGEAQAALETIEDQQLTTFAAQPLAKHALEIALHTGRSVYDSAYLALAENTNAQLLTADEKLVHAAAGNIPVKWLGAI